MRHRWLLASLFALTFGCSSGSSNDAPDGAAPDGGTETADAGCPASDAGTGCNLADDLLVTCSAAPTPGVYGVATWECTGSQCPYPSQGCWSGGTVSSTLNDGGAVSTPLGDGFYSLALPAGSQQLCFDDGNGDEAGACATIDVKASAPTRVDLSAAASAGGNHWTIVPR
jgi:hypothetical protein